MRTPTRSQMPGTGVYADDTLIWRARQIITAGYTAEEAAQWIGCPLHLAQAACLQAYSENAV